jgi:predicted alpha-1,2-mannosidase
MPDLDEPTLTAPDLTDEVNLLQGTRSTFAFSTGNTAPLVTRPFGMTAWSLQSDEGRWFYHPDAPKLQGVRATHQPSPWIGEYGSFTVMPQTGPLSLRAEARSSSYHLSDTTLKPHVLRTTLLRFQVGVELTPTERCALMRFAFDAGDRGRLVFEPAPGQAAVEFDESAGVLRGTTCSNSGGVPDNFALYYVAVFDRPWAGVGVFVDGEVCADRHACAGERAGAFVEFDASPQPLLVRVGTSFISHEQALLNLHTELPAADFEAVEAAGKDAWNQTLGSIQVHGGDPLERRTLYSCLYRAHLFPRLWHELDANGAAVHYSPYDGRVHSGELYADNGFWDTHRTFYPLLALLDPERLSSILRGWTNALREGGWFPKWSSPGYRACMVGTHIDAVIADAAVKGIQGFDLEAAYQGLVKHATTPAEGGGGAVGRNGIAAYMELGYVPDEEVHHATAETLDFAYGDFCIAQIADLLGRGDEAAAFRARALNYRNVFDGRVGFMRGKRRDGAWVEPFDEFEWGGPHVEGSAWQGSWAVPHDVSGLAELHGGADALCAKLDALLSTPPHFTVGDYGFEIHEMTEMALAPFGQCAHSNQPVHHVLYLYALLGQPWKTRHWVHRVLRELYSPDDLPGDEDNGEMAAWFVFSALGFYPVCPGQPEYVLGAPLFDRITIRRPDGWTLTVETARAHSEDAWVEVDGRRIAGTVLLHETLSEARVIRFYLADARERAEPVRHMVQSRGETA